MSSETTTANAYLRTKVLTASQEELRLLLLDGAIKFACQGRDGLVRRDFEASYNGISQARNIVVELMTTMRPEHDPELCERLRTLYCFMFSELVSASLEKDSARVESVIKLLEYERETWAMLMEKIASERASARTAEGAAANDPAPPEVRTGRPSISVEA